MIVGDAAALYPHRGARGQNGERRALRFDALGRVSEVQDANGNRISTLFDAVGRQSAQVDTVSRATYSSQAFKGAVSQALSKAG